MPTLTDAIKAKAELEEARTIALEENAQHLLESTIDEQVALDLIVQELCAEGVSKAKIALAIGESRSTIYMREARINGEGLRVRVWPTNAAPPSASAEANTEARYTFSAIDGTVTVAYDGFGPENISGRETFTLMIDEGDGIYWLSYDYDDVNNENSELVSALDTVFGGFYYDDFLKAAREEYSGD